MQLSPEEAQNYAEVFDGVLGLFDRLDELPQPTAPLHHKDRDPGRIPTPEEDPYNAFLRFCGSPEQREGPLAGLRVGVKDNISPSPASRSPTPRAP